MQDIQIKLSVLWIALMLVYLLGDVMRIFSGDFVPGEIMGAKIGQWGWLGIAFFMLIPIIMVVLNIMLGQPVGRWVNIIVSVIFFIMNLAGLPSYPSHYDKFLIAVSLVVNVLIVRYAWFWV
ncbi:MAG: hypothetical protein JEZ00_12510 [Anaerolineaceae bacterium]|nr:hypothetical protein [Anaerolineaceae bacterium]